LRLINAQYKPDNLLFDFRKLNCGKSLWLYGPTNGPAEKMNNTRFDNAKLGEILSILVYKDGTQNVPHRVHDDEDPQTMSENLEASTSFPSFTCQIRITPLTIFSPCFRIGNSLQGISATSLGGLLLESYLTRS
jgi:hypothetical protein